MFIIIYILYSKHCNCIVLNSTIVIYNYSQHFYDLYIVVIPRKQILTNFYNFVKFTNFNEFLNL